MAAPLGPLRSALIVLELEEVEELADVMPFLGGVAHGDVQVDRVVVASADSVADDVSGADEVGNDPLRGALGDADALGEVTEACVWVAAEAKQNLRVVREEPPRPVLVRA